MAGYLHIGEAARLLGITPKAIRHYEKMGLLGEPARTEAGYRCLGARELLRLQRIHRLQGLGLSLRQIKSILGGPAVGAAAERPLPEVLGDLRREIAAQVDELQERLRQIDRILADAGTPEGELDAALPPPLPPSLRLLQETLGGALPDVPPAILELEKELVSQLDLFLWSEPAYQTAQGEFARFVAAHPEEYRSALALMGRLAALAELPADAPEVEGLAREVAAQLKENPIFRQTDAFDLPQAEGRRELLGDLMGQVIAQRLSPAQQRFAVLLAEYARGKQTP